MSIAAKCNCGHWIGSCSDTCPMSAEYMNKLISNINKKETVPYTKLLDDLISEYEISNGIYNDRLRKIDVTIHMPRYIQEIIIKESKLVGGQEYKLSTYKGYQVADGYQNRIVISFKSSFGAHDKKYSVFKSKKFNK